MKIRKIKLRELKEADIFKEKILNPEKKEDIDHIIKF